MKVLICCITETWGGLEQTAFRDAVNLRERGFETAIFCVDRGAIYENAREKGIPLHTVPPSEGYFNYGVFRKINNICKRHKFDIVHLHDFNHIFSILLALRKIRIPVVATRHIYVEHVKKDFFIDGI